MNKASEDCEKFSEVVGFIYDASSDPDRWQFALRAIQRELRASYAIAILAPDSGCGDGLTLILTENEYLDISGFNDPFLKNCPFASIAPREVATIFDLMGEVDWFTSPFFRHVASPGGIRDILCIEIRLEDRSVYRLRFTRSVSADCFGVAERKFATLLVPHLTRAFRMGRELARRQLLQERFTSACNHMGVAMIVLDSKGHVLEQNSTATQLISNEDGLTLRNGMLFAIYPGENRILQKTLRNALSEKVQIGQATDVMCISRKSASNLGLLIHPIPYSEGLRAGASRPSAIIFIRDPEHRIENGARIAQILYQLTQVESVMVMRLINGFSLQEAAEDMNIKPSTARTHLRSIFNKVGVSRQSDLVRQVLNGVTLLGAEVDQRM